MFCPMGKDVRETAKKSQDQVKEINLKANSFAITVHQM
jgi:hypothetical protein